MTGSTHVPLRVALEHIERTDAQVRLLKAKLPDSDVSTILHEVLNRVRTEALLNDQSVDAPSRYKIEKLCHALISADPQEAQRFIESAYQDGASLDAIYLRYLAEAARVLGEWWEDDEVSFHEVAIGTSRIYAIIRGFSYLFVPSRPVEVKSAVFASIPGETHLLGVRMAADMFGKHGWNIDLMVGKDHDDLVAEITRSTYPIIGLSAGGTHSVSELARLIIALRISNPWAAIVLSGQITNETEDVIATLDVDGVVSDIDEAITLFDRLWKRATAT